MIKLFDAKMTSRERVLKTFRFERADRVPLNYFANPIIHSRFAAFIGVDPKKANAVQDALDIDFRGSDPKYTGPFLFKEVPGINCNPVTGHYTKWVDNEFGGYEDYVYFPLANAEPEFIASYPVPNPDDFDYEGYADWLGTAGDRSVHVGGAGSGDIINRTGMLMGMENTLVNLATEDEATLAYLDRRISMQIKVLERQLETAKGRVDFMWLGEDLGTQIAPMISLEMYRRVLRPRQQRYVDLAKAYGLYVMVHGCGSSSWVYEDYIEMGINGVDTLQPEAVNMSPEYLKEHYGGRLCFHGCISTTGNLFYGSASDVAADVNRTLDILSETNGYMLSPAHNLQDNMPVENILAMYQTAHARGR